MPVRQGSTLLTCSLFLDAIWQSMFSQILVNALVTGADYALLGLSFALIYRTVRFFHFAHGVVFTMGAYSTFVFKAWVGFPLFLSILLGVAVGALIGCLIEIGVFRPLRRARASSVILLLSSLGIYVATQNVISMVFGDDTKTLPGKEIDQYINIFSAGITPVRVITVCVSICLVLAVAAGLTRTKIGGAMRAVANDAELACVCGVKSDRVILWVFGLGSGIAALAGILVALDIDMTPTMGLTPFMMAVVAVIVGGMDSIPGVALGAIFVAAVQHATIWLLSSLWQGAIVLTFLILFLLVRPQGFLGSPLKSAAV
jgi:branched-chain amino acid transport system permease protein